MSGFQVGNRVKYIKDNDSNWHDCILCEIKDYMGLIRQIEHKEKSRWVRLNQLIDLSYYKHETIKESKMYYYTLILNGVNCEVEVEMCSPITQDSIGNRWLVTAQGSLFRTEMILIVRKSTKEEYAKAVKETERRRNESKWRNE